MQEISMCYYLHHCQPPIYHKVPPHLLSQLLECADVLNELRRDYLMRGFPVLALLIAVAEAPAVYAEIL